MREIIEAVDTFSDRGAENMDSKQYEERKEQQLEAIMQEIRAEAQGGTVTQKAASRGAMGQQTAFSGTRLQKGILFGGIGVVLLLSALTAYTYLYSGIHYGLRAGTVAVGGMSQSEAAAVIEQEGAADLAGQSLDLSIDEKNYAIDVQQVTDGIDSMQTAQDAYDYTHTGGFFTRLGHTLAALGHHKVPLQVNMDSSALGARLDAISAEAMTEPVQPSWSIEGDNLVVDSGTAGVDFDRATVEQAVTQQIAALDFAAYEVAAEVSEQNPIDMNQIKAEADSEMQNATLDKTDGATILASTDGIEVDVAAANKIIAASEQQTYRIPITRVPATITAEELSAVLFRDVLGEASTDYSSSNSARAKNVRLATGYCNSVILNPGESFSYNTVVGKRTAARGFQEAGAYVNGELVSELGGGVCQPSSTLYMAVLRADLNVVERQNHSYVSAYTPLGEDATVSFGGPDFCFSNDTDYPVKIIADSSNREVTMTILGTNTTDKSVKTEREVLATYEPGVVEQPDATLDVGKTSVKQHAATGYKVKVYQLITENGETTRVLANTSTYKKKDKIVLVGTKPVATETTPAQTEDTTQSTEDTAGQTEEATQQTTAADDADAVAVDESNQD